MATKPILFNTEMVKAILDGRKTQTRRIVKGLEDINPYRVEPAEDAYETLGEWDFMFGGLLSNGVLLDAALKIKAPYAVGDVLWVRETWCAYHMPDGSVFYTYKASDPDGNRRPTSPEYDAPYDIQPWHPSIHMPKKAARIFLKVTDIRAERLKEISNTEAIAEGVPLDYPMNPVYCPACNGTGLIGTHHPDTLGHMDADCPYCADPVARFSNLWDSTVTDFIQFGYHANPWVWVIEFERCEKPKNWLKPIDKISKKEYTIDVGGGIDCLK